MTHTIAEGAKVVEAQNRYQRIVQVGTQQRSLPHLIKAREILQSGQLGTIHTVHMSWNRKMLRRLFRRRRPWRRARSPGGTLLARQPRGWSSMPTASATGVGSGILATGSSVI